MCETRVVEKASLTKEITVELPGAIFGPVQTDRGFVFQLCLHFRHSNTVVTPAFASLDTDEGMIISITDIADKRSRSSSVVCSLSCILLEPLDSG